MRRIAKSPAVLWAGILGLCLSGCGGGGGGGGNGGGDAPQDQTLTFADPGPIDTTVASKITPTPAIRNVASGGGGTGAITYSSDNPEVAAVDTTTGSVDIGIAGTATITARKAASAGFTAAGASYVINVARAQPTITLPDPGPVDLLIGATGFTNSAGIDAGDPASIVYQSALPSVATVNAASGAVTAVDTGSTVITARFPRDDRFEAAEASYTLNVVRSAAAVAWVGADGSEVTFGAAAGGADYLRSTERDCDIGDVADCSFEHVDRLTASGARTIPLLDATMNLPVNGLAALRSGHQYLQSGPHVSDRVLAGSARFSPRVGHGAVFFDDRFWVIAGGIDQGPVTNAQVWSSDDGSTWELVTDNAAFGPHWFGQYYAFDGRLWTITTAGALWSSTDGRSWTQASPAGLPAITDSRLLTVRPFGGDVWMVYDGDCYVSEDGLTWSRANTVPGAAGGAGRRFATLNVFRSGPGNPSHLYLIGGDVGGVTQNSVWRSTDGNAWTALSPPFAPRAQHTSFVFGDRLWVMGGVGVVGGEEAAAVGDTWSTADGITWTEVENGHLLDRSYLAQAVVAAGTVKIIGGVKTGYFNQVFESTDGVDWVELSPYAAFTPRTAPSTVVFNGEMWTIGGRDHLHNATAGIWRSSDGATWTRVNPQGPVFSPGSSYGVAVFEDRLWVTGGWDGDVSVGGTGTPSDQVWSSADGITWTEHAHAGSRFSPRYVHQLVAFGGRLWVYGGIDAAGTVLSDVWSSVDGETWVPEAATTAIGPRAVHRIVEFAGQLWWFGGTDGPATYNDVWRSSDGIDWRNVVPVGPSMSPRLGHQVVVFEGRMWVIGGADTSLYVGNRLNDVWSTTDGVTWIEETPSAAFGPRWLHTAVAYDGAMWLMAGADLELKNDVWRSTDGHDWRLAVNLEFRLP